jgi:hypothetical protein
MSTLEVILALALAVAVVVVLVLVLWLPRHVALLVAAERGKAWAAFHATMGAEMAPYVTSLRGQVEWLAAFTAAQYAQAQHVALRVALVRPPAIAPPGSAHPQDPAPAVVAAGLGPRPAGRTSFGSAPTLVSMQAVAEPRAGQGGSAG